MSLRRHLARACVCALLSSTVAFAYTPSTVPATGLFQPFLHLVLVPLMGYFSVEELALPAPPETPIPPCMIAPLPSIDDPSALALEEQAGIRPVVDLDGLTPVTARALADFESAVNTLGGTFHVHSAHRPQAYQDHLRAVWDKWMFELRDNQAESCQSLRADVEAEFLRHGLLDSQRPAMASDHTRGTAFDAAVSLPRNARIGKRRVNVDTLARRFGIHRPVRWSDPVHFRFFR